MSSLPKPQDSMLRDVVDDDCGVISCCCCCCGEACRLKRDVCDGANAMVCVEKSAIAAEAWATRVLLMVAAFGCMLSIGYVWSSSNGCVVDVIFKFKTKRQAG